MRRQGHLTLLALVLLLLATSASWAQTDGCTSEPVEDPLAPFGYFGGPLRGANSVGGVVSVVGWAMSPAGIERVHILVDGLSVGEANYGKNRPGVSTIFSGFPGGDNVGYGYRLDTTRHLNGLHELSALAVGNDGRSTQLNTVVVEFVNTTHLLDPFGAITFPRENATMTGKCDIHDEDRFYSVVKGFALDAGVEIGDMGIGYVELLIDGVIYFNTRRDCTVNPASGGLSNCYGLIDLGLTDIYPTLRNTPNAGFRFVLDVGALLTAVGVSPGSHILTVRSGDIAGQVANIDEMPVTFFCQEDIPNQDAFGQINVPPGLLSGTVSTEGWALDLEGVEDVMIFVDGITVGDAAYGLPRPGIADLYPSYPDSAAPGWMYLLDTTELGDGEHRFLVVVRDKDGPLTLLGEKIFTVKNHVAP